MDTRNNQQRTGQSQGQERKTTERHIEKDFYEILGVEPRCTQAQIEEAFKRKAKEWHPEKHPNNRVEAQNKFNQICEAYAVLSDESRRHQYDEMSKKFGMEEAEKIFTRFFDETGLIEETERDFFKKNYPQRKRNYYEVLGVSRNASMEEIQRAYRRLALQYHPKNNPGNAEAEKNFLEVCEAYNHLSHERKRRQYDELKFSNVVPSLAQDIFEDFFGDTGLLGEEENFFGPIMKRNRKRKNRPLSLLDQSMGLLNQPLSLMNRPFGSLISGMGEPSVAEHYSTSTVQERTPKGMISRTITERSNLRDGKRVSTRTEEITHPDGSRDVTETIDENGERRTNTYRLEPGMSRPMIGQEGQPSLQQGSVGQSGTYLGQKGTTSGTQGPQAQMMKESR